MRKLKIIEHISLDGVIQASGEDGFPYSDWKAPYRTPAGRDAIVAAHGTSFRPAAWPSHLRYLVELLAKGAK
jgi:hypothetical protein